MPETGDELDVAIVGMAGRFPGAPDVATLWHNLAAGRESVSFFDDAELAAAGVPAAERDHPDYVPAYGVLPDADRFDARFFGYSARDASVLDPQQRLFLQTAWQALESSGHLVPVPGDLTGVYAGTSVSTYLLHNLLHNPAVAGVSEYELLMANDKDSLAARVAYHLDLRGPAVTVQTACSSSLVAVHLAGQALLSRECDVAIAGGAHVRLPMNSGYRYEPGGIMSRDGHCRAFDAAATGTVGGNGVAAVVLRRLADARRDGDTVYAVIRGSAINNDGGLKVGFPAPGVEGQVAVIRAAQQAADVDPATIGYVEAHGTGTSLGDRIEFQALVQAFRSGSDRAGTDRVGYCRLGSVKTLIGHLDAAAGVAGLIKTALAVRAGVVPPNPYVTAPHPELGVDGSPFVLAAGSSPWPRLGPRRRAAVSSFGVGGTNAHVVVEEASPEPAPPARRTGHLILASARTADALDRLRADLARDLTGRPDLPPADVAHTLQATRRRFDHRLALAFRDTAAAGSALAAGGPGVRTAVSSATGVPVAFLFPGQGSQRVGMAADLYREEPAFADALDECAEGLRGHLGADLRDLLYPADDRRAAAADLLGRTRYTQPALFAVEYALAVLWRSWGIEPAALLGHSVGEYAAACLAGVFALPAALAAVAERGRLMQEQPSGDMLAVHLPAAEVRDRMPTGVCLAADNAPGLSVVAGPAAEVRAFAATLAAAGVSTRALHTSHAFHSEQMDPVVDRFAAYLADVELREPRIPMLSNVTGDWLRPAEATDPRHWARQIREPVRFAPAAATLLAAHRVLVEVGPGSSLSTLVRQQEGAGRAVVVASLGGPGRATRPDGTAFADALGQLWLAGVDLDPAAGWAHERRRRVPLPTYPFEPARHWVDPPERTPVTADPVAGTAAVDPAPTDADPDAEPDAGGPVPEPVGGITGTVRRIWADLLGVPDVGLHDDFFELGGHSLLGTKVLARLRDAVGVELAPATIFEASTVAELAEVVRRAVAVAEADAEAGAGDVAADAAGPPDDPGADVRALLDEIRAMSDEQLRAELSDPNDTTRCERP